MRSVLGLVALLIAMAIALLLAARETRRDMDAVRSVTFTTPSDVTPSAFDARAADALAERLRLLADQPELPLPELREAAARAASWTAALSPGSFDYHMAVNLRAAADELIMASTSLSDPHRARARQYVDAAVTAPGSPGGGPPGAIGGVRDQLQNLQQHRQEQVQETDREAH
ncbi:MAG TPA: hypothetical protein VMT45_08505 [Thermoanaerobaculaceae bacterium]|nr:hypothetical protein [Thermoanaerobaculaceae bacterium]